VIAENETVQIGSARSTERTAPNTSIVSAGFDSAQGTVVAATTPANRISQLGDDELRRMVGPDPVRPGPSRYRIYMEDWHLPIWPIIGQLKHVTKQDEPAAWDTHIIAETAKEWGISLDAMAAALLYYKEHRCAIDAWLAENEAA
jgi:hypothetical protein